MPKIIRSYQEGKSKYGTFSPLRWFMTPLSIFITVKTFCVCCTKGIWSAHKLGFRYAWARAGKVEGSLPRVCADEWLGRLQRRWSHSQAGPQNETTEVEGKSDSGYNCLVTCISYWFSLPLPPAMDMCLGLLGTSISKTRGEKLFY